MRSYYEDDVAGDMAYPVDDETVRRPTIQQESLRGLDWIIAAGLALFTGGLLTLWAFPGLSPDAWEDMAIGAGVRPIKAISPGFWTAIARGIYSVTGIASGTFVMQILGRVFAGVSVGLVYLLLRQVLSITIRVRLQFSRRRFFVVRGTALLGALFFACSDPVWRVGQAFTPSLLLLFMTILVLALFFGFLMTGRMGQIYSSMFLLGLLSAETPMGFFLLALVWGVYALALRHDAVASNSPILNPIVEQSSKWHLTFLYAFGLVLGIAANCIVYIAFDGLEVFGVTGADMPLIYATHVWSKFVGAASGFGWVLGLGICVLPFVVATILLPRAVDEEQFLPYHIGAVYFVVGVVAFAQLAELPPLWFWTWTSMAKINSPFFLLVLMLFSAASVVFALAVMAVEVCCRDHRRLALERFAELNEEEVGDRGSELTDITPLGFGTKSMLVIVPLLLVAAVLPGRYQGRTRKMLAIVNDYAREVLVECGDVRWLFSEGMFDSWLELSAASEGRSLKALSMFSDNSPRERYIRTRGESNEEARVTLSIGAPMALRTVVRDHPDRLNEIAIQLGFEMWKQDGKEIPLCTGVLSRPGGMEEVDRLRGVETATALADRILEIYYDGGPSKSAGSRANDLFRMVQWRIARIARMRAERADRQGQKELSLADSSLSDRLDHHNAELKGILHDMDKVREQTLNAVTPRHVLQLALARRDFTQARRYADLILENDPNDPDANFGVGMFYYTLRQWTRAEEYLRRCLIKRPKQPTYWNNLAMICLYTERYDEGLKMAQKALEIIPESAEVKDTIKQLTEAREKAKKGGEAKKPDGSKKPEPSKKNEDAKKAESTKQLDAMKKSEPTKKPVKAQTVSAADKAKAAASMLDASRSELQKAYLRADFEAAVPHAEKVLTVDADDPLANFVIGMRHFNKRQWAKAEERLKRSLAKNPTDPLALRNLAITYRNLRRYDEALKYAQKARSLLPGSRDVEDTIRQIKQLKEKAEKEKNQAGKSAKKKPAQPKPAQKKQTGAGEGEAQPELKGTVPAK